jgi:hypothetical protein
MKMKKLTTANNLKRYWLSVNKENNYIRLKNESNIEEKIDRMKNKMDKFKI